MKEISKRFKKQGRGGAFLNIDTIIHELVLKNNEFSQELASDKTILNIFKIKKLRERAQEGHIQLDKFSGWLMEEFRSDEVLMKFDKTVVEILNNFEKYIVRLKEHETALLEVFASWGSLLVAMVAIIISLIAISMR